MSPRLRVALASGGVMVVVIFVLVQIYLVVLSPLLQWRSERAEDRAAYQSVARMRTRAEVEQTLSGWKAERLEGTRYCQRVIERHAPGSDACKSADHEAAYRRQRSTEHNAPLTPLQILVVYDRSEHVVATDTLD